MLKIVMSFIVCILFYACTGQGRMVRTEMRGSELDTLDVIFDARADSQITVHTPGGDQIDSPIPVIPPEPQQPAEAVYFPKPVTVDGNKGPGFRVQVMASSSQAAAIQYLEEAKQKLTPTGYVIIDNNLWKVQMGDFVKREDAEALRKQSMDQGFSSAWIVLTQVWIPVEKPVSSTQFPSKIGEITKYRIQIFAGNNKTGADEIVEKAKDLAGDEIFTIQEQGLWKVRVGDFETRELAERALTNWKNQGYRNAWVVEIR